MPIYPLFAAPINIGLLYFTFFCYCHMTCMSWGRWGISSPIGTGGCRNQWQKWAELGNRGTSRLGSGWRGGYKIDDSDCNQKLCCRVHIALGSRIFFDFLQDGNSGKKTHSEHFLDGKQLQVGFWEAHHLRNGCCFSCTSWKDDVCVCLSKKLYIYISIHTKMYVHIPWLYLDTAFYTSKMVQDFRPSTVVQNVGITRDSIMSHQVRTTSGGGIIVHWFYECLRNGWYPYSLQFSQYMRVSHLLGHSPFTTFPKKIIFQKYFPFVTFHFVTGFPWNDGHEKVGWKPWDQGSHFMGKKLPSIPEAPSQSGPWSIEREWGFLANLDWDGWMEESRWLDGLCW